MSKKVEITKDNFGDLLIKSAKQALDHAQGKITLKSEALELPSAPPKYSKTKIKKIREERLKVSQPIFAKIFDVSIKTVQAWEIGGSSPKGPARRILQSLEKNPEEFLKLIAS